MDWTWVTWLMQQVALSTLSQWPQVNFFQMINLMSLNHTLCVAARQGAHVQIRQQLWGLALSSHHVGLRDQTQVTKLEGEGLHPLSQLTRPVTFDKLPFPVYLSNFSILKIIIMYMCVCVCTLWVSVCYGINVCAKV